jgi:hypothetical protein
MFRQQFSLKLALHRSIYRGAPTRNFADRRVYSAGGDPLTVTWFQ